MPERVKDNLIIEDARIVLRNFSGKAGTFNDEGERSFGLILDDDIAEQLLRDGWLVKHFKVREEGEPQQAWLPVEVRFTHKPPHIVVISSKGRNEWGEDEVEMLDKVDIKTIDLVVRPYNWAVNGKSGIKAYLKSIFVTLEEDAMDRKYADNDLPTRSGRIDE